MEQTHQSTNYGGDAPANYQKFFVPSIAAPVAEDFLAAANLKRGERVLDMACGTGVVTRLAAESVAPSGKVTGLDLDAGMLAVAQQSTPPGLSIEWLESDAKDMALDDGIFDVVLCQMGLQFVADKTGVLREMHRVLAHGGRAHINVPGPKPELFATMAQGIERHIGAQAATFTDRVFSLHDADELRNHFEGVGFRDVQVDTAPKRLVLPPPREFLWQYIHSTPIVGAARQADQRARDNLEREICDNWADFVVDGNIRLEVGMTTVSAVR